MDADPITVLVCGPEDLMAAFPQHVLERAEDGYRTVELAQRTSPSFVLVDQAAAALAPADLVRRLRQAAPQAKVVFVLTEARAEDAAEILRAGADGVLAPGPGPETLRWALEEALAGGSPLSPLLAQGLVERFAETVHREQQWAQSLAEVSRQAENLAATKAEFLSNVSHELRTPLTIIKGVAQVIGKFGDADEQQAAMLAQLEEAATKLTRMVENLLVIAEMERGEFRLDLGSCDMAHVVREGSQEAAHRYPQVTLDLRVPASVPATADAERMREVVRHLVDNACRYSEEGGTVTVQARSAVEGITVSVTDQGAGVDRRVVSAAFGEAFSPGEAVMTKEKAGLGLGLNLARSIIALHGGILTADPLPGGGSRLSFVLPPEPKEQPAPAPVNLAGAEGGPEGTDDPLAMLRDLQRKLADSESRVQ
ncbi:MAG TPA: HAMP domain-containing sensor histidine kinase [Actinomycetota bacterium]